MTSQPFKNLSLWPVTDGDREFLYEVYASTRKDEIASFGWDAAPGETFLRMQFDIRERSYVMQFPHAEQSIIRFDDSAAGSIFVNRGDSFLTLIDVAVLPEFREKGIATRLVNDLKDEATATNRSVILHVERDNTTALRLYERCGFSVSDKTELYYEMRWPRE